MPVWIYSGSCLNSSSSGLTGMGKILWVGILGLLGFELEKCLKLAIFDQFLVLRFQFHKDVGFIGFGF